MSIFSGANNPGISLNQFTQSELLALQSLGGLGDPNADRILFWDDSAGAYAYLALGTNLSITGTTLNATGGGGGVSDADYGDITVSGTGTVWTIDNGVVSLAKMANVATATVFYRKTAGTGAPEVQTLATLKTDLGLTGTNSGDQTSVTGNAGTATALQTARTIGTLTGDATTAGSSFDGTANNTNALVFATVNSNVGTFGSATQSVTFTVNAKGLVTAAANVTVTPAVGSITGLGTGVATFLATPSSANLISAMTDETGTGVLVFANTPTLVTPVLGAATATTINGLTITTSAGGVLTIAAGKTVTMSNTMTFSGTDSAAYTMPTTNQTIPGLTTTSTLTNKRITPRVNTEASSATSTPTGDSTDIWTITALAAADAIAAPTGTPTDGQMLIIRILDNGTARALTWNAIYRASSDLALPTTTILSKTMYCGFIYNVAASKWDFVAFLNNF